MNDLDALFQTQLYQGYTCQEVLDGFVKNFGMSSVLKALADSQPEYSSAQIAAQSKRLEWLSALEEAGVDNWSGMEEAQNIMDRGEL